MLDKFQPISSSINPFDLIQNLNRLREERPLIHNITNYVVMNWTANCLLAVGASPVMAHAYEEAEEMVSLARALVINIGTLSAPWIKSMDLAMVAATKNKIPIILDPVGAGATQFRTKTAKDFLSRTTVLRSNASELLALSEKNRKTKGVDSVDSSETTVEYAKHLSKTLGCVVCISGEIDFVVQGDSVMKIMNGHSLMTKVTGMGCAASALVAAFNAIEPSPFKATCQAMTVMGIAGELAAETSSGPGSFQSAFLDVLFSLDDDIISQRQRLELL